MTPKRRSCLPRASSSSFSLVPAGLVFPLDDHQPLDLWLRRTCGTDFPRRSRRSRRRSRAEPAVSAVASRRAPRVPAEAAPDDPAQASPGRLVNGAAAGAGAPPRPKWRPPESLPEALRGRPRRRLLRPTATFDVVPDDVEGEQPVARSRAAPAGARHSRARVRDRQGLRRLRPARAASEPAAARGRRGPDFPSPPSERPTCGGRRRARSAPGRDGETIDASKAQSADRDLACGERARTRTRLVGRRRSWPTRARRRSRRSRRARRIAHGSRTGPTSSAARATRGGGRARGGSGGLLFST